MIVLLGIPILLFVLLQYQVNRDQISNAQKIFRSIINSWKEYQVSLNLKGDRGMEDELKKCGIF